MAKKSSVWLKSNKYFIISTFNTDYILIKEKLKKAVAVLKPREGYEIKR